MPIPSGYSRTTFHGTLPGGEIFNWSLWANEAPADQAATQAQATAFATELLAAPATGQLHAADIMSTDSSFTGVRVYSYADATGHAKYIAEASAVKPGSGIQSGLLPNQCAIVATLKTGVAGRRNTGRVYLPATKLSIQAGGQWGTSGAQSLANWLANFISRCNSHIGTQKLGILSQTAGTFQPITTVFVDARIDIQRRRANRLVPVGSGSSVVV